MTVAADPLLAALIAKLPASGTLWSAKKRAAWLQLVWLTFDMVYEADAGDTLEIPAFLGSERSLQEHLSVTASAFSPAPAPAPASPNALRAFVIDREGFARRGNGDRVMPGLVNDVLFDQRGETGDLGAIIWADGSTGVRGLQLEISPA